MHISICNGQLSILPLQRSTRNATASFEFFSNLCFYLCFFACSKQVGFFWSHVLFQKENFSILVQNLLWLKIRVLFRVIIVKVMKTSHNVKSRVLIVATIGSVYLRYTENNLIGESVTITSELSDHSRAAAITVC